MKIAVVNDGHSRDDALEHVLQQRGDTYAYIHCGDIDVDPEALPRFVTVSGSNDIFYGYPDEQILNIGTHRVFIVHSHQFVYSHRSQQLVDAAKKRSCDIVYYGHTHITTDEAVGGIRLVNPESLQRGKDGKGLSYALLNIDGGTVDIQFEFLPRKQKKSKFFW